jgi:hypothetical protein
MSKHSIGEQGEAMNLVKPSSLAATLDAVNDVLSAGRRPTKAQVQQVGKWLASRQGQSGAYADMFAPTPSDFSRSVRLYSGERIRTRAAIGHILGEEACRILILLGVSDAKIRAALERAQQGMLERLRTCDAHGLAAGTYCCATCTCALWRHLAVGGLDQAERRLAHGIRILRDHREPNGRWRRYPFYYTLLALAEIHTAAARAERRHAAPACERVLRRMGARRGRRTPTDHRRQQLAERILSMG